MLAQVRNPVEWAADQVRTVGHNLAESAKAIGGVESRSPKVKTIRVADIWDALRKGLDDFGALRTDVILLCLIYPVVGFGLTQLVLGHDMLPMLLPLAAGFALIGPAASVAFYEMSRRREKGGRVRWADAFGVALSPRLGGVLALTAVLVGVFAAWLIAAQSIYNLTLGPELPTSLSVFLTAVFTTEDGWRMIALGSGAGLAFGVIALSVSVVSFPLLIDRNVGVASAIATSVRAVIANPVPMAVWGVVVAFSLILAMIPLLLGLVVVVPVLGHATWHLYRRVVEPV